MLTILDQKYPAPKPTLRSIIVALFFGLFIGLFLLFFEPFGTNLNTNVSKEFQLFFFGFITTLVLLIFLVSLPFLFPFIFSDEKWKVKHQIVFYIIILFVISTANGVYTNYINTLTFSWSNYWWIINRTFVLGGIPIAFLTLLDYQRKFKLNTTDAHEILASKGTSHETFDQQIHHISTDLKDEIIILIEEEFNYAVAVGNYIDVWSLVENTLQKATYRVSLSAFEAQLVASSSLVRCHRSYLINLKKIDHIAGNAQGLKLQLKNQEKTIPVSRMYIPKVRQYYNNSV